MKSFADWTQELAESVGEVKHHWETSGAKPVTGFDWGAPVLNPATCKCDYCGLPTDDPVMVIGGQYGSDATRLCEDCYKASIQPATAPPQIPKAPLCEHCAQSSASGRWQSYTGNQYDLCDKCGFSFGSFNKVSNYP